MYASDVFETVRSSYTVHPLEPYNKWQMPAIEESGKGGKNWVSWSSTRARYLHIQLERSKDGAMGGFCKGGKKLSLKQIGGKRNRE